jgi:nucleotide-binding universal stress UspA family protein
MVVLARERHSGEVRKRGRGPIMFRKILVATDGSDHALHALKAAAELGGKFGAEIVVVSVLETPAQFASSVMPEAALQFATLLHHAQEAQKKELAITETLLARAGLTCRPVAAEGHVANAIVHAAEQEKADLIVIGSRGMGTFGRLVLGSTSDAVAHHAPCPVMIVR